MSASEMRIELALWAGWKRFDRTGGWYPLFFNPDFQENCKDAYSEICLPRLDHKGLRFYLEHLAPGKRCFVVCNLLNICDPNGPEHDILTTSAAWLFLMAEPIQIAEALCRTLWPERFEKFKLK